MNRLDTLRSLQQRIREATGADRELDLEICKALRGVPADAIWEVPEDLPPELAKHYKREWTTPAYVDHMREYSRGIDAAFAERLLPDETAAKIRALEVEWDFKNSPPFGHAPNFTSDPDGLGACVSLQREVLPGWDFELTSESRCGDFWATLFPIDLYERRSLLGIDDDRGIICITKSLCLSFLDAIFSAVIAEEEAKQATASTDAEGGMGRPTSDTASNTER